MASPTGACADSDRADAPRRAGDGEWTRMHRATGGLNALARASSHVKAQPRGLTPGG